MAEIQKVRNHTWFEVRKGRDLYGASFCDPSNNSTYKFESKAEAREVIKRIVAKSPETREEFEFVVIKVEHREVVVN